MIVALCGNSRVGKDEVGRYLIEDHGHRRAAKGDLIKTAALGIDPLVEVPGARRPRRLAELVDAYGWERVKDAYPEARRFLQELPDRVVDVCAADPWNDAVYRHIDAHPEVPDWVLTRVCLPVELEPLYARGGELWRVDRPGCGPIIDPTTGRPNPNEVALDGHPADRTIRNTGTLDDLRRQVAELVKEQT